MPSWASICEKEFIADPPTAEHLLQPDEAEMAVCGMESQLLIVPKENMMTLFWYEERS